MGGGGNDNLLGNSSYQSPKKASLNRKGKLEDQFYRGDNSISKSASRSLAGHKKKHQYHKSQSHFKKHSSLVPFKRISYTTGYNMFVKDPENRARNKCDEIADTNRKLGAS